MSKVKEFLAELRAMGRETVKDVRQTVNQMYFDKPEHAPEPGTPLNLTPRETYEQKHQDQMEPEKTHENDMEM